MNTKARVAVAGALAALAMAGCANMSPTEKGAVVGGVVGGVVGAAATEGSALGTAAGAVGGAVIGHEYKKRNP